MIIRTWHIFSLAGMYFCLVLNEIEWKNHLAQLLHQTVSINSYFLNLHDLTTILGSHGKIKGFSYIWGEGEEGSYGKKEDDGKFTRYNICIEFFNERRAFGMIKMKKTFLIELSNQIRKIDLVSKFFIQFNNLLIQLSLNFLYRIYF